MFIKLRILASTLCLCAISALAKAPEGYYSSCAGKCGHDLLRALYSTISDHTEVGYGGLWQLYKTSDVRSDGTIWDMYSTSAYRPGNDQCGTYALIGDCYNREHSFPKSWFDDKTPMYDDAFHIYPTDGKVNGQRSNHPYGECANGTSVASRGSVKALGKLGKCTFPGYSGTVFEPDNQYKGDFARSYFYMAACYNDRISSWNSDMLAGNSYPVFSDWAINLLLKWNSQDPVSEKETNRNDVVFGAQHNRNPFIDHPELVDHIWGDLKNTPWPGEATTPKITSPQNGAAIDFGPCGIGVAKSMTINVHGMALSQNVSVTVSGDGFSASPLQLSAEAVNSDAGAQLTLSFVSNSAGSSTGWLTLTANGNTVRAGLSAEAVSGIPVLDATDITETSFVARWVNIDGPDATYTLSVNGPDGQPVSNYPRNVAAATERHEVTGLEPSTTYTYTVSSASMASRYISVTTGDLIPFIQLSHFGDIDMLAAPGEPSEAEEVIIDADNVFTDIDVTVSAPFQLSTDKSNWAQAIRVNPFDDHFFVRIGAAEAGKYMSTIEATCTNYSAEAIEVHGTVTSGPAFFEDFEKASSFDGYGPGTYEGSAANWQMKDANVYADQVAYEGKRYARFGKSSSSVMTMTDDKPRGIGTVKFMAAAWSTKEGGNVNIDCSTDGGATWTTAGTVGINSETYTAFTVTVNAPAPARIRFCQNSGARLCFDNIEIDDFSQQASVSQPEFTSWHAYCRNGRLVVETSAHTNRLTVYGIDGSMHHQADIGAGCREFFLTPGLYIVVIDGYGRRVVIK